MFPQALIDCIRSARVVAGLTGAGISAESGVPTFRDAQTGLWAKYRAEELATPQAFRANPGLVWDWYTMRRGILAGVAPNPGHVALARWQQRVAQFTLVTQNVDGLHEQAGSHGVLELHGNIRRTKCFACGRPAESFDPELSPPSCTRCDGDLRPDVVWFGESLPADNLTRAIRAVRNCELFLTIGTSGMVQPAASLPYEALARDIPVLEINPQPTPFTPHATWVIQGRSGVNLPRLLAEAWPETGGDDD